MRWGVFSFDVVGHVEVRLVMVRQIGYGAARWGVVWFVMAGVVRWGQVGCGAIWFVMAGLVG